MKKSYILLFVVTLTACNNDKTLENPKEEVKELVPVDKSKPHTRLFIYELGFFLEKKIKT